MVKGSNPFSPAEFLVLNVPLRKVNNQLLIVHSRFFFLKKRETKRKTNFFTRFVKRSFSCWPSSSIENGGSGFLNRLLSSSIENGAKGRDLTRKDGVITFFVFYTKKKTLFSEFFSLYIHRIWHYL